MIFQERLPIPEEEEEIDEDTEGLSNIGQASLSHNQDQGSSEAQTHSEPIDATIKENSDEIQTVTDSMANMKTEHPNSNLTTSEPPSQNEPEPIQSNEQANSAPIGDSSTVISSDNSSSNEKGIQKNLVLIYNAINQRNLVQGMPI